MNITWKATDEPSGIYRIRWNTQHTPGPWAIRPTTTGYQVEHAADGIRSIIAECHTVSVCDEHGSAEANARLIAAAPWLLAAAQSLLADAYAYAIHMKTLGYGASQRAVQARVANAKAAIAKATNT